MSRCLYDRCLFLSHAASTSHDVISGTSFGSVWIMILCSMSYVAWCKIPLFVVWSYLDHGFLYPACLGVWSSDFLQALWCHGCFSFDLMVVFPHVFSCFLFDGLAYFRVLYSLFIVAESRHFSSFRRQGTYWWRHPRFMWLVNCLSYSWCALLDHVCDGFTHGVDVV